MGTQYKVSELMDNYLDMEFLPERQQGADTYNILRNVRRKVKVKKRIRLGSRILAAIAAAVTVIITVTATSSPYGEFTSLLGGEYRFSRDGSSSYLPYNLQPYEVEGDRVFFTADDQHIDITDFIKNDNVYFYEYKGVDSHGLQILNYVCIAGTSDDLGFGEIVFSYDFSQCIVDFFNSYDVYYLFDGEEIHRRDLTEEQYKVRWDYELRYEDKTWWKGFESRVNELRDELVAASGYNTGNGISITWGRNIEFNED